MISVNNNLSCVKLFFNLIPGHVGVIDLHPCVPHSAPFFFFIKVDQNVSVVAVNTVNSPLFILVECRNGNTQNHLFPVFT